MPLEMMLFIPWLVTVITETVVSILWGFRKPGELLIIALINTATNISLNALLILINLYTPHFWTGVCILVLEVIIFFVEAALFKAFLENCRHPYLFSLTLNAASFAVGQLVFRVVL